MKWITRSNIKVDRVACPWLIKRFGDPQAEFLFVEESQFAGHRRSGTGYAVRRTPPFRSEAEPSRRALFVRGNPGGLSVAGCGIARLGLIMRGQERSAQEGLGLRAIAEGFASSGISDEEGLARQFPVSDALCRYAQSREG
jgi:hypothetical protein